MTARQDSSVSGELGATVVIYPLALGEPAAVTPLLRQFGVSANHFFDTLITTAIVVFIMVYVAMPRYTQLIQQWLVK